jgi:hypothetical protein
MNSFYVLTAVYVEDPGFTAFGLFPYGWISMTQKTIVTIAEYVGFR